MWDYPRPPRVETCSRRVRVLLGGEVVADSTRALRVLETSGPPTIYIPSGDVRGGALSQTPRATVCEWKGTAAYFDVEAGGALAPEAAWSYPAPSPGYEQLVGHVAFYPGRVEACFLDDERVRPQPGGYYGGWITADIVGPFKGEPGTEGW